MKALLHDLTPPLIWRQAQRARGRAQPPASGRHGGFEGDFSSWEAARAAVGEGPGYEADEIIAKTIRYRREQIVSLERDAATCTLGGSRLLAALGLYLARRGMPATFRVLDLGGELGIHYRWIRHHLVGSTKLRWDICETPAMVRAGKEHFAGDELRFFDDLGEVGGNAYELFYSSGCLQYLPDPHRTLGVAFGLDTDFFFIDRLPLTPWAHDRLTVQRTRYPVPAWFFSEALWMKRLDRAGLDVIMRCTAPEDVVSLDGSRITYQALALMRRASRSAARTDGRDAPC